MYWRYPIIICLKVLYGFTHKQIILPAATWSNWLLVTHMWTFHCDCTSVLLTDWQHVPCMPADSPCCFSYVAGRSKQQLLCLVAIFLVKPISSTHNWKFWKSRIILYFYLVNLVLELQKYLRHIYVIEVTQTDGTVVFLVQYFKAGPGTRNMVLCLEL